MELLGVPPLIGPVAMTVSTALFALMSIIGNIVQSRSLTEQTTAQKDVAASNREAQLLMQKRTLEAAKQTAASSREEKEEARERLERRSVSPFFKLALQMLNSGRLPQEGQGQFGGGGIG